MSGQCGFASGCFSWLFTVAYTSKQHSQSIHFHHHEVHEYWLLWPVQWSILGFESLSSLKLFFLTYLYKNLRNTNDKDHGMILCKIDFSIYSRAILKTSFISQSNTILVSLWIILLRPIFVGLWSLWNLLMEQLKIFSKK